MKQNCNRRKMMFPTFVCSGTSCARSRNFAKGRSRRQRRSTSMCYKPVTWTYLNSTTHHSNRSPICMNGLFKVTHLARFRIDINRREAARPQLERESTHVRLPWSIEQTCRLHYFLSTWCQFLRLCGPTLQDQSCARSPGPSRPSIKNLWSNVSLSREDGERAWWTTIGWTTYSALLLRRHLQ